MIRAIQSPSRESADTRFCRWHSTRVSRAAQFGLDSSGQAAKERRNVSRCTLRDRIETRIARFDTPTHDWDDQKFQEDFDPRYRLAKLCSIGAGGAGVHGDRNTVVPGHFAVSTIVLRARGEGLLHVRDDVEKTFFIHGGEIRPMLEKDDEKYETIF